MVNAPGLRPDHYAVFDCAMGERSIAPMGHVRMMAATQPFLSGAISKTINMPESATVEDVEHVHMQGWKLGLKALAIYRDNCKVGQPLSNAKPKKAEAEAASRRRSSSTGRPASGCRRSARRRRSRSRSAGAKGYLTASSYPDDGLGEVFLKMSKQGSTLAGVMDAFSIAISVGLQYGVPLETYVGKFTNMRFEPAGMTDDPDIRMAASVMDYIFRRLALDFLPFERRAELGIFTAAERAAQVRAEAAGEEFDIAAFAASAPIETKKAEKPAEKADPPKTGRRGPGPRWSCWNGCSTRSPTRRCASPAARRCARPAAATSARAAAPPAAAADARRPDPPGQTTVVGPGGSVCSGASATE